MIKIPEPLKEKLISGNVIPFIGAGVSRQVINQKSKERLFPTWREFLITAAKALDLEYKHNPAGKIRAALDEKPAGYLKAAKIAEVNLSDWFEFVNRTFNPPQENANEDSLVLADLVWSLGSNFLITTNIDNVLQWTCPNPKDYTKLVRERIELGEIAKKGKVTRPTVWHLHGSVNDKEKIVFTSEQYKDFYDKKKFEGALVTLKLLLAQKSFLFVGFSLDDIYFLEQLEYINKIYGGGAPSHYILLHTSEVNNLKTPRYINVIEFEDFDASLLAAVRELSRIANTRSMDQSWKKAGVSRKRKNPYAVALAAILSIFVFFLSWFGYERWKQGNPAEAAPSIPTAANVSENKNEPSSGLEPAGSRADDNGPPTLLRGPVPGVEVKKKAAARDPEKIPERSTGRNQQGTLVKARSLFHEAKLEEAIQECNRVLQRDPQNQEAKKLRQDIMRTEKIVEEN